MKSCAAFGCSNSTKKHDPSVSFHKFPAKTKPLFETWCKNIRRSETNGKLWYPKSVSSHLCSKHFTPESFVELEHGLTRRRLHPTAVPTIFSFNEVPKTTSQRTTQNSLEAAQPFQTIVNICSSLIEPPMTSNSEAINDDDAIEIVYHDVPHITDLRKRILELEDENSTLRKKLNNLKVKVLMQKSKLMDVFEELKQEKCMNKSAMKAMEKYKDINITIFNKTANTYSKEMKEFAVTLMMHSTKGYQFLRRRFMEMGMEFPSVRTVSQWMYSVDANAGITSESIAF